MASFLRSRQSAKRTFFVCALCCLKIPPPPENTFSLLELGCGNGRDAIYFHQKGFCVTAIDQTTAEINLLKNQYPSICFLSGDFTNLNHFQLPLFDVIYSRFTLHSINENDENHLLKNIPCFLKQNGLLAIEARGLNNSLFGKGKKIAPNSFIYEGHFRRFIDFEHLKEKLKEYFVLEYAQEKEGFAPFLNQNDVFFRLLARKK